MLLAEMRTCSLAPGAHEVIIQSASNGRTGDRNQTPRPLLGHFRARFYRDALDYARHKPIDHFLFEQFAADVDSGCAGGRYPKVGYLFVGIQLKTIDQAELLGGAHRDGRKYSEVGQNCEDASKAESRTLGGGDFHASPDCGFGDVVEAFHGDREHALKGSERKSVRHAELHEEAPRIDLDRVVGTSQTSADRAFDAPPQPCLFLRGHSLKSISRGLFVVCIMSNEGRIHRAGSKMQIPHFVRDDNSGKILTILLRRNAALPVC